MWKGTGTLPAACCELEEQEVCSVASIHVHKL